MQRIIRQTLQRLSGGSCLYRCGGAPNPTTIPKPNPSISLPLLPLSSSFSGQFSRATHGSSEAPRDYFYCNTDEFKNDNTRFPHGNARLDEHEEDDDKLMEDLGLILRRENSDSFSEGEYREYKQPISGLTMYEPLGEFPPNPYGISGPMFFLFGKEGGNVKYNMDDDDDDDDDEEDEDEDED